MDRNQLVDRTILRNVYTNTHFFGPLNCNEEIIHIWPSYHPCMRNVKIIPGPVVATIKLLDTTHYKIIECLRMFFFFLFLDSITTCYYYHDVSFPSLLWARVTLKLTWSLRKVTSINYKWTGPIVQFEECSTSHDPTMII